MTIRSVLKMGEPRLYQIAEPVTDLTSPEFKALLIDLFDTMEALDGAGLAAPQIGISKRVVVFGFEDNPRYPEVEPVPVTVLINPIIEPLTDQKEDGWEGCLSVPGMRGLVPRYTKIRYTGLDQTGKKIDRSVSGFHARVVQHECDHLDGILYPFRITDLHNLGFLDAFEQSPDHPGSD